jgi:arabinose-5-phosphate isomerase
MERHGYGLLDRTAEQCMTRDPVVIGRRQMATAALALMEERKITSLPVTNGEGVIEGVVHLHDLWKTEMI